MEIIGWAGTTLVIVAYFPQIKHLVGQRCAWGISLWTWSIWLFSSSLLLGYAAMRSDALFIAVQGVNILTIAVTIFLVRRSNTICLYHLASMRNAAAKSGKLTG